MIDSTKLKMTGEFVDKIYKNGVLVDVREGHNLVVNTSVVLMMTLLKNQSGFAGIQYWAVGSGLASWDTSTPSPTLNEKTLVNELGRKAINPSDIVFLDSDFNETTTPTNIIQITTTFGTAECNGAWREFGIFGGNASSSMSTGLMLNHKNHAILQKTSDMTVERKLRFTLTL